MKNSQTIPESQKKFEIKFKALLEKANHPISGATTIFTDGINISTISDTMIKEHYDYFIHNYIYEYHQAPDAIEKSKVIINSINESFFQDTFNKVLDSILLEGEVTLENEILLENTVQCFNLDLTKVGKDFLSKPKNEPAVLEESVYGFAAGGTALLAGMGAMPSIAISGLVSFIFGLLMPAKKIEKTNEFVGKYTGIIGRGIVGAFTLQGLFAKQFPNVHNSHRNIINFDNVDADPAVISMFKKIQKINVTHEIAQRGLQSIVQECVNQNRNLLDLGDDQFPKEKKFDFFGKVFGPQNYNVLKLMIKSMMGEANTTNDGFNTLLRFRKCLSTKLVDIYKLLLISNLSNKQDHTRILHTITKANSSNPEQLLNFLPTETEEDKQLKEAVLSLIMFRIHLSNLAKDLETGFFEVDKEAGKFLKQKLLIVDGEVDQYLKLNRPKTQPFEGSLMDRKPLLSKQSLLSKYSLPK